MQAFTMHHTNTMYGTPCEDRMALIRKAHQLGFDAVEFGVDLDYAQDPLIQDTAYQKSLREQSEQMQIEPRSLCLHLLNYQEHSPASEQADHRQTSRQLLQQAINTCQAIGASVILMPFFGTAVLRTPEHTDRLIHEMQHHAAMAESLNVCLALETSLEAPVMRRIIEAIGSPAIQCYFDTGNAAIYEYDLMREVQILGDTIAQVHIKNQPASPVLTDGRVDFAPVLKALRQVGFAETLVLELPASDEQTMQANLATLKQMADTLKQMAEVGR